MTREETQKILMTIQAAYPNYKVPDKTVAIDLWMRIFQDMTYEMVNKGLQAYILADKSGFAPAPGQVRWMIKDLAPEAELNESEAWALVYRALQNANYNAIQEFNALPDDVRRAVGDPIQLKEWATMDEDSISVAESNFKRTYRGILDNKRKMSLLPEEMRPMIAQAPVAAIEDRQAEDKNKPADPEWVSKMLTEWRAKNEFPQREYDFEALEKKLITN